MMGQLNNKLVKAGVGGAPTVEDEKQIYVELIKELSSQLKEATIANEKKSEFDDSEKELLEALGETYNGLCIHLSKLKGIDMTEFNNDIINYNNALKVTWDEETLRCGVDGGGRKRRRKSRKRKKKSKRRRKRRRRTKKKRRRRR